MANRNIDDQRYERSGNASYRQQDYGGESTYDRYDADDRGPQGYDRGARQPGRRQYGTRGADPYNERGRNYGTRGYDVDDNRRQADRGMNRYREQDYGGESTYDRDRGSMDVDVERDIGFNEQGYGLTDDGTDRSYHRMERSGTSDQGRLAAGAYNPNRGPYTGRGPKGYQRSDERIMEDVCETLTQHGQIDASNIEVSVQNGEVTLSGTVEDRRTKRMAEDAIENLSGVQDVHNQIRVRQRDSLQQGTQLPQDPQERSRTVGG